MSNPEKPRIAVIIPCYEDGDLAAGAIASVHEREPIELVVVDDGSRGAATLAALERLESEGVHVIRHDRNRGLARARTTGLRATTAPYVFPLDADDEAVEGMLGLMAARLEQDDAASVCFGDYVEFGRRELVRAVPSDLDPFRIAYTNEYPVSAMFRRSALEEVDGWRPIDAYEDWHLWMTLAERGSKGVHLGQGFVTYRRRLHGERMLTAARRIHPQLYRRLREEHAQLFRDLRDHRRRSTLGLHRKLLYPIVYGGRIRFSWEGRVKSLLDRAGVWTLRR